MPQTPVELAAKIDRLSRAAHAFHRFAHHPLCNEYAGEVVRLGKRTRVCRGCLAVASGVASGVALSVVLTASTPALVALGVAGTVLFVSTMFAMGPLRHARGAKLVSRFLPATAIAYTLARTTRQGTLGFAVGAGGALALSAMVALYRRRGPDRTPCASCPERTGARPCRGVAPIVRRERAFRRLAGQWLARVDP